MLIVISFLISYAVFASILALLYYFFELKPAAKQAKKLLELQSPTFLKYKIYAPY